MLLNQVNAKDYKRELLANHANLGSYNDTHYTRLSESARPGYKPGSQSVAGATYTMESQKKQTIKDQISEGTAPNQQKMIFRIKENAQHFNINCDDPKQKEQRIYDAKPEHKEKPAYFNEAKNFGV